MRKELTNILLVSLGSMIFITLSDEATADCRSHGGQVASNLCSEIDEDIRLKAALLVIRETEGALALKGLVTATEEYKLVQKLAEKVSGPKMVVNTVAIKPELAPLHF